MPTVTLLEKLYGGISTKTIEERIQALCEGLEVAVQVMDVTDRGWICVETSGEDEVVASNLIEKEFGFAPVDAANIKEGTVYRGKALSGNDAMEFHVDLGVFTPSPKDASVSLHHLQAQLVDGRKMPLQRIIKLFCLLDNIPLKVLIKRADAAQKSFVAELSEKQISLFYDWIHSSLDRIIILGAFLQEIENVIKASGHFRDVVEVESLGFLEHAIVCKLGTDGAGLIPRIGRRLPRAVLGVFSPKEIMHYTVT